jgi:hypothetical protein
MNWFFRTEVNLWSEAGASLISVTFIYFQFAEIFSLKFISIAVSQIWNFQVRLSIEKHNLIIHIQDSSSLRDVKWLTSFSFILDYKKEKKVIMTVTNVRISLLQSYCKLGYELPVSFITIFWHSSMKNTVRVTYQTPGLIHPDLRTSHHT